MALLDTTKLLYTALSVGVVGGTGAGAYYYLSNFDSKETNNSITPTRTISIATKLSLEKYELLESNSGEWTQILTAYKENTKLHFEGFDGKTPQTGAEEKLKELCNEASKLDSSKDTNNTYNKAKKWCTKPRSLTDLLGDRGYTMLNTTESGDPDADLWDTKLSEHKSLTVNSDKKFTALGLTDGGASNQTNRSKLRGKCRALKDKKHYEKEFEKELDQAMLWCSTNKK